MKVLEKDYGAFRMYKETVNPILFYYLMYWEFRPTLPCEKISSLRGVSSFATGANFQAACRAFCC